MDDYIFDKFCSYNIDGLAWYGMVRVIQLVNTANKDTIAHTIMQ